MPSAYDMSQANGRINGNEMRYQGVIEAKPGSRIPYIYDVYFVQ